MGKKKRRHKITIRLTDEELAFVEAFDKIQTRAIYRALEIFMALMKGTKKDD